MLAFARLFGRLDATTRTSVRLETLADYFRVVDPADAAWAVFFLSGHRLKRLIRMGALRDWAAEAAGVAAWLFEESYHAVGDFAEALALLVPGSAEPTRMPLHACVEQLLVPLPTLDEAEQRERIVSAWRSMDRQQRLVFNKLLTGGFRVGVSQQMVTRALALVSGQPAATIAHRLMGTWRPTPAFFQGLIAAESPGDARSQPYPFLLAHPLAESPETLGEIDGFLIEWKWDGIRAQLVRRGGQIYLWSRGEEVITDRFPEIVARAQRLPEGTVLDGEVLAWKAGQALPFGSLQRRLGRKHMSRRILAQFPAAFLAFDLLEMAGSDIRAQPLVDRRARLEALWRRLEPDESLLLSPRVRPATWQELTELRQESRRRNVEGLMLKGLSTPYAAGRPRGLWWKWKIEPFSVDAVMIYAQLGHGRRASLFTDYTFGLWHDGALVPFAKAYSGLTDEEIRDVDRWIRRHTIERHGPVRRVEPALVFEIAFEAIGRSTRHRSGVAVRFPRIARWRRDKQAAQADSLASLLPLLKEETSHDEEPGGTLFDLVQPE